MPVAVDLEDLVDEPRNLDLQIVLTLRRRSSVVEAEVERPGGPEVYFADDRSGHEVRVMGGVHPVPVLADQTNVLRTDEEAERAARRGQVRVGRRVDRLEGLAAPAELDALGRGLE